MQKDKPINKIEVSQSLGREEVVAEVTLTDELLGKKVEQVVTSSSDPRLHIEVGGRWFSEELDNLNAKR